MRERRVHVGGEGGRWWLREFHSDKLVEDGGPGGGWRVERGGGIEERKGVSWDVRVCFSSDEVKMDATAGVQADLRQR